MRCGVQENLKKRLRGGKYKVFPEHLGEEPAGCRPKTDFVAYIYDLQHILGAVHTAAHLTFTVILYLRDLEMWPLEAWRSSCSIRSALVPKVHRVNRVVPQRYFWSPF